MNLTKEETEKIINNLHHVEALMVHNCEILCDKKAEENKCALANNCLEVAERAFSLRIAYKQSLTDPDKVKL